MKIIKKQLMFNIEFEKYFADNNVCFIDIETTGLSRIHSSIYLIGILYFDHINNTWTLKQLLAESLNEEMLVLLEFIKLITRFNKIITYNGETFDIPFINNKLLQYNIDYQISNEKSFDLYRLVRENRYFLNLENLKLKTIEKSLGIYREDVYSGKECIEFYLDYIITNDEELEERLLKHNYDDLYYLPFILEIQDIIDDKKTVAITEDINLYIEKINTLGDIFVVKGMVSDDLKTNIMFYENNHKIIINENNKFEIAMEYSIGLVSPTEKGFYVNKKELALSDNIFDSTSYNIPDNIILLKVEKDFCLNNIKIIIRNLVLKCLEKSF